MTLQVAVPMRYIHRERPTICALAADRKGPPFCRGAIFTHWRACIERARGASRGRAADRLPNLLWNF